MTWSDAAELSAMFEEIDAVEGLSSAWCIRGPETVEVHRASLATLNAGLSRRSLYLWRGRLRDGATPEVVADLAGFSSTERDRLARYRSPEDRAGYAAAHGMLRLALGVLLGHPPGHTRIGHTAAGAPELVDRAAPKFSLSHSRDSAAIALAARPVGVDLEYVSWTDDLIDVSRQVLSPATLQELRACPPDRRAAVFARHWTLSEAFVKATGCGFANACPAAFSHEDPPRVTEVDPAFGFPSDWQVGLF